MNIEDMIKNGASEEQILEAIEKIRAEKVQEDARKKDEARKNQLIHEARANLMNSLFAYCEAFGIMSEEDIRELDEDDLKVIETEIAKMELKLKSWIKLFGTGFLF